MMAEPKEKPRTGLREPKRKKLGLSVPPALRLPHEDLIHAEELPTLPSQSSQSSLTRQGQLTPSITPASEPLPVAPLRDFTKVANSIQRQAIPAGVFSGKSKQLYDTLYSLTRGAIVPSREVRISRPKLMKKAGIGARVTFETNIERLVNAGLLLVRQIPGEHEGNEYTIFLPEEATMPSQSSQTSLTTLTDSAWKVDRLVRLESSQTRHTLNDANKDTSEIPKTSFKTNTNDDDEQTAISEAISVFREASFSLTGRGLQPAEREKWAEVARVIVGELNTAATRAGAISSVPAFLTAHLKRRFAQKTVLIKGEGKAEQRKTEPSETSAPIPDPNRRLTAAEIIEQSQMIVALLESGAYTLEQAAAQFAGSFHPDDWNSIRENAVNSEQ